MKGLPTTTTRLLRAVSKCGEIKRVCISAERIDYLPSRTRKTSDMIQEAGISDLVQKFVTHTLSKSVSKHFRKGSYDLTGGKITIIK